MVHRRPIHWVGSTLADLRAFPAAARRRVGQELDLLQQGMEPTDFKPMPSVGPGVCELRIRAAGAFRVFYVAKFADGLYVLHAFRKKRDKPHAWTWNSARSGIGNFATAGNPLRTTLHDSQDHARQW